MLISQVTSLQMQLKQHTEMSNSLTEQLALAKSHLQSLEKQSEEKSISIKSLTEEMECLRRKVKVISFHF